MPSDLTLSDSRPLDPERPTPLQEVAIHLGAIVDKSSRGMRFTEHSNAIKYSYSKLLAEIARLTADRDRLLAALSPEDAEEIANAALDDGWSTYNGSAVMKLRAYAAAARGETDGKG